MISFIIFALAALAGYLLTRFLIPFLSIYMLDSPNHRSSHFVSTPRGGGISFVLVASAFSIFIVFSFADSASPIPAIGLAPLICFPLALVGFLDDRFSLPASFRYLVQCVTALCIVWIAPFPYPLVVVPFLLIFITAVINFTNFMDGLDGLVAGCTLVAMSAAAVELQASMPVWSLIGALFGFLFFNWSPAKVFMGDVGSTFLGAMFSVLVLQASSWSETLGLMLVATPLLGDASLCVVRRLIAGQSIFEAHRLHLFQRLHQAGWSHARVSSLYISATAVLAIVFLSGGLSLVITFAALELLIGIWLDQTVAVHFSLASRS